MDAALRYGKLMRVFQQYRVSDFICEHRRSMIAVRLEEALTTRKEFHERDVTGATDIFQEERKCGTTSMGSDYLHIDLYKGTCSWLSILKSAPGKWFHGRTSTLSASKHAWKSSSLHGWFDTCSIRMANVIVYICIWVTRRMSLNDRCLTSPIHPDSYLSTEPKQKNVSVADYTTIKLSWNAGGYRTYTSTMTGNGVFISPENRRLLIPVEHFLQ